MDFRRRLALWICPDLWAAELAVQNVDDVLNFGRRAPSWWADTEVRDFLAGAYGDLTLAQTAAAGQAKYGYRCPSKSTIHRFWQRLDAARAVESTGEK